MHARLARILRSVDRLPHDHQVRLALALESEVAEIEMREADDGARPMLTLHRNPRRLAIRA